MVCDPWSNCCAHTGTPEDSPGVPSGMGNGVGVAMGRSRPRFTHTDTDRTAAATPGMRTLGLLEHAVARSSLFGWFISDGALPWIEIV